MARLSEEAARQHLAALRTLANPTIDLVAAAGPEVARDESVLLAQPLDVFGQRRALAHVAAADLRRAQAETTGAERTLVVAVKNAATDLFLAQEAESLSAVQVEVAQLFRDAAARRAQLGDVPPVQVQRADLELLRAQNDLTTAATQRLDRRAVLNQLIGQAPETPLRVTLALAPGATDLLRVPAGATAPAGNGGPPPAPGSLAPPVIASAPPTSTIPALPSGVALNTQRQALLAGALAGRPDLLAAQAVLASKQAQADVVRRDRLPTVQVQVRRAPFFGRPDGGYALRLEVALPVFDFGSIRREHRAAEADARAQAATVELLRTQIATQIEQALLRLGQQQDTVGRYHSGIVPLAIDLLRKAQIGYAAGATTYLEVLDAQRSLRQVQSEYLQALTGVRSGEAALESAIGAAPPANFMTPITTPSTTTPGAAPATGDTATATGTGTATGSSATQAPNAPRGGK